MTVFSSTTPNQSTLNLTHTTSGMSASLVSTASLNPIQPVVTPVVNSVAPNLANLTADCYSLAITTKDYKHCRLYFTSAAVRDRVAETITLHYKTKVERSLKLIEPNRALQNKVVNDNLHLEEHSRIEHIDRYEGFGVFEEPLPYLFAQVHTRAHLSPQARDGWHIYSAKKEYARFGIHEDTPTGTHNNLYWKFTSVNKDFKMCSTYPQSMVVSRVMLDRDLERVFAYRSKGRIPVLSWKSAATGASICRCSQPLVGFAATRCAEDERYLETLASQRTMYVLDARPKINAIANTANGAGFENIAHYDNCKIVFMNIPNIHVMRKSLERLVSTSSHFSHDDSRWWSLVEESGWLGHIKGVLAASVFTAELVQRGNSVLVHCSDGWDRTPQMTSLAQILLDPYYRTIIGLEVLIEKEWLSFGHKFAMRIGHLHESEDERSPIFIQFLDALFQLVNQFPMLFEYTPTLLLFIAEHLFSCKYGTFLYSNEKERVTEEAKTRTVSIWSDVNASVASFTNPFYMAQQEGIVIKPNLNLRCIELWKALYMRYDTQNTWSHNSWMVQAHQSLKSLQFTASPTASSHSGSVTPTPRSSISDGNLVADPAATPAISPPAIVIGDLSTSESDTSLPPAIPPKRQHKKSSSVSDNNNYEFATLPTNNFRSTSDSVLGKDLVEPLGKDNSGILFVKSGAHHRGHQRANSKSILGSHRPTSPHPSGADEETESIFTDVPLDSAT
eukprot:gene15926-18932_t